MESRTIGAKPRPRALILQFDDDIATGIAELFPTSRSFPDPSGLGDVLLGPDRPTAST